MTLFMVDIQHGWNDLYEAAVFELNPSKLPARVLVARNAITARLAELNVKDPANDNEKRKLADAARMLEMLLRVESTSNDQNNGIVRIP